MGGLTLTENVCFFGSSFLEYPIPKGIAFIGEIGLSGELRTVPRIDKRVHALAKLGYKTCVVPKQAVKALGTEEDSQNWADGWRTVTLPTSYLLSQPSSAPHL
ncbi:hypothetical protein KIW84_060875 [Lathyrus oleraceus]|uniref:DNA repair protein RadA n=1 Tax=Pisum sativum TaxID=3888 RepID=A0A9D4W2M7_PEA|nr:hypothetical protein KIW84_060875 [Pisum sativum]